MDENARLRAGQALPRRERGEGADASIHWENGERMLGRRSGMAPLTAPAGGTREDKRSPVAEVGGDADPAGKQGALSEGLAADQPPNPGTRGELLRSDHLRSRTAAPRNGQPSSGYRL